MVAGRLIDNLDNCKQVLFTVFFDADGEVVGPQEPTPGYFDVAIYENPGRGQSTSSLGLKEWRSSSRW